MKKNMFYLCLGLYVVFSFGCAQSNSFLQTHDHNSDGRVTKEEYDQTFSTLDSNGDGLLDDEELGNVLSGH